MLDLTVVILTKDEQIHIERALRSVLGLAKRIVVVDSFSTDDTKAIALANGACVFENKFINQAKQFQWALDNCGIDTTWIMRLDADEIVEADLKQNLILELPRVSDEVVGFNLKRKHVFWGKWIRFGGRYPLLLLRVWRNGFGRVENRWMDEHVIVWGGKVKCMEGGFIDHNLNDLSFFTDKHNRYATREAVDVISKKYALAGRDGILNYDSTSFQAFLKRWVKEKIYNRIPFPLSSFIYFCYRYFILLGFLDGLPGLVYHFLQGYWYRFLVGAKLKEYEDAIAGLTDVNDIKLRIELLTGYKIV